jgi:hypothetical protein
MTDYRNAGTFTQGPPRGSESLTLLGNALAFQTPETMVRRGNRSGRHPPNADGLLGPEPGDQPSVFLGALGETPSGLDRQQGHLRCLAVFADDLGDFGCPA